MGVLFLMQDIPECTLERMYLNEKRGEDKFFMNVFNLCFGRAVSKQDFNVLMLYFMLYLLCSLCLPNNSLLLYLTFLQSYSLCFKWKLIFFSLSL